MKFFDLELNGLAALSIFRTNIANFDGGASTSKDCRTNFWYGGTTQKACENSSYDGSTSNPCNLIMIDRNATKNQAR